MALARRVLVCLLGALALPALTAVAAPVLRGAEVRVEFQSPTACVVELTVNVEGAAQVEHRVEVVDGARVELSEIRGAAQIGECADGRAHARARGAAGRAPTYTLRYAVEQPPSSAGRCPLWIPGCAGGRPIAGGGASRADPCRRDRRPAPCRGWRGWATRASATLGPPAGLRARAVRDAWRLDAAQYRLRHGRRGHRDAGPRHRRLGPPPSGVWHDRAENDAVPATCARSEANRRRSCLTPSGSAGASTGSSSPPRRGWRSTSCGRGARHGATGSEGTDGR